MALTKTEVSKLYVAIFNRASEGEGNKYWQTNQPDMVATANTMLNTDDAKAYFGSTLTDNQAFIELIYKNTLNKTVADDKDGIDYWVKELNSGKTKGEVVAALVNAVSSYKDSTDATTKAAYDQFMNRVEVSNYTADHLEKAPADYATSLNFGKDLTVTEDKGTLTSAEASIDTLVSGDGSNFVLTTGVDTFTGTAGDDTFIANGATNAVNGKLQDTLQSVDSIDGGAGTDTLSAQVGTSGTANIYAGTVKNVETLSVTSYTGNSGINMANVTGATTVESKSSVASTEFINVGNLVTFNVNGTKNDAWIDYTTAAIQSTTDEMTINLTNVDGGAAQNVEVGSAAAGDSIETLTVNVSGTNNLTLGGTTVAANDALANTTTMNVTGDGSLVARNKAMTSLTKVDASAATGNISLDLSGSANIMDIKGGAGDDDFLLSVTGTGNFTNEDSVDLGAGTDTAVIGLAKSLNTALTLNNVENLELSTAGAFNINLDGSSSIEKLHISGNNNNVITANNLAASVTDLTFDGTGVTTGETISGLVYNLKAASGTTDSVTVHVTNETAANIAVDKAVGEATTIQGLTLNGVETMTLDTVNLGADTVALGVAQQDGGLIMNGGIIGKALRSVTIDSDTFVNAGTIGGTAIATVDASAATAGIKLNVATATNSSNSSSTAVTITTGDGIDTIVGGTAATNTINSGAGNDTISIISDAGNLANTINAGAGNDIVTGGQEADTIDLGDGADTYITDGTAGNTLGADTISGFTAGNGGDIIDFITSASGSDIIATGISNNINLNGDGGGAVTASNGMNIISDDATTLDAAGVLAVVTGGSNDLTFANSDNIIFAAIDNGASTVIALLDDTTGDTNIEIDDITIIATLTGVADATTLTAANLADFV